ncbi:NAD(P)-dependent oxidoreductase [Roseococcus sp. SYP-B2431]|uniref:NAD(P)-dependent oxidoreductase n=1 Tax=Roseococcus sp. SYP-B2431 TaxID=2496640 RepID=UPI00103E3B2A|nr:NAD(P)-dependent oxidoreductase [Roseococcus sp. SYP-B2431]TCH99751.1 NAD(P)-dependent oxidoreductase [Roseococcus sp. SYP-B2431]
MIGLIGLGRMGGAMLRRLRAEGQPVLAYDLDPRLRQAAAEAGATAVDSPAGVTAAVVLLSLPQAAAVSAVLDDLLPVLPPGAVIADTSTLEPVAARGFAADAARVGIAYLDAPVSGGPAGAASGALAMMVGGDPAALERSRPLLSLVAARIVHVGPSGAGQIAKLANNLLVATHLAAAAEALRMADAAGLAPAALLPVLNAASGRSAATEVNWPRWIGTGAFDSGFTAGLMRKDLRLALGLAAEAGTPLSVCAAAVAAWEACPVADAEEFNRVADALFARRSPSGEGGA